MHVDTLIHRKPEEKVVFYLRRHPIIVIGNMLLIGIFASVPFAVRWFLLTNYPATLAGPTMRPFLVILTSAYYLLTWLFFFSTFVDYYLDAWIVTNDRVLNVEQHGLFSRTISELDLSKVQDVTSEVKGVFPFFFGYGDVFVQTAGEKERFVFEQVPKPDEIRKRLLILVEEDRKRQGEVFVGRDA